MIKPKSKKKFSLLMAIVFLFTIMVPLVGPAAAATTYTVHSASSWDSEEPNAEFKFSVKIDPCDAGGHSAVVRFPSDVVVQEVYVDDNGSDANFTAFTIDGSPGSIALTGAPGAPDVPNGIVSGINDNQFKMDFTTDSRAEVNFTVTVKAELDNYSGVINAEVERLWGDFVTATINGLGRAGDGEISVTADKVPVITESGGEIATLYMKESTKGATFGEKKALQIKLPKGYEWDSYAVTNIAISGSTSVSCDVYDDGRSLYIAGNGTGISDTIPNYLKITGEINVIDKKAKFGDIEAELTSDVTVEPSSIVVGKYADYEITVEADEDDVIAYAGRIDEEISDIIIKEEAPGTLLEGRSISLTLPENAKWLFNDEPELYKKSASEQGIDLDVKIDKGDRVEFDNEHLVDSRTLKMTVSKATKKDGNPATIRLQDLHVSLAADATGDLVVEITGSAGAKGEVTVAEVVAPVTATADIKDVKIGLQAQAAGDITIVEAGKEAIMDESDLHEYAKNEINADLLVRLPNGIDWATTPKVTVTDGDLEIGEVKVDLDDNWLVIPIEETSDSASTIKITDVKVTVNRDLPEGKVDVKIGGGAINETYDDIFRAWTVASTINGNVITPAPGETKQNAVFILGSSTYTVNGIEQTMDAPAFAQDSRTYLPLRYAGLALGVSEGNILWDGTNQTATLIKGSKIVQVQVGNKMMNISGAQVGMDVAPIARDGRIYLPFRWIATAFGASVDYDATNQTVTMNLDNSQQN